MEEDAPPGTPGDSVSVRTHGKWVPFWPSWEKENFSTKAVASPPKEFHLGEPRTMFISVLTGTTAIIVFQFIYILCVVFT